MNALSIYNKKIQDDEEGKRPLFRNKIGKRKKEEEKRK